MRIEHAHVMDTRRMDLINRNYDAKLYVKDSVNLDSNENQAYIRQ